MDTNKVWLVTGASSGLGLAMVKKLLDVGYKVAATTRNLNSLIAGISGISREQFLPLEMHITDEESVQNSVEAVIAKFGKIDAVVNNAGFGQIGAIEELTAGEVEKSFQVNVFGLIKVIRNVMPYFRKQQSGHFFNTASIGGYVGSYPGWGVYCASKFAVAGLTEALFAETKSFGIKATILYLGAFRTNFLADSLQTSSVLIDQYTAARTSQAFYQNELNGNQQGDPEKFAEAVIEVYQNDNPPLHLFLGRDTYNSVYRKIESVKNDVDDWKALSFTTSF